MGISFVPVAGSALQVAFNEIAGRRLADRRARWLNTLASKVHDLEEQIGDFAALAASDEFRDALTTASQIADRTSRTEKLEALRNAVVNSVMPNAPDPDEQQILLGMIDRFTPTHVQILVLLKDPQAWFESHGIEWNSTWTGEKKLVMMDYLIKTGMPRLSDRSDLASVYASELYAAGLIGDWFVRSSAHVSLREPPDWLTRLGGRFLDFISDPAAEGGLTATE